MVSFHIIAALPYSKVETNKVMNMVFHIVINNYTILFILFLSYIKLVGARSVSPPL